MEDRTDIIEQITDTESDENIITESTVETEPEQTEAVEISAQAAEKPERASWWKKGVTRRFLAIALAVTLLLNAGLTAGIMALFAKNSRSAMPDMPGGGRPGFGRSFDGSQGDNQFGGRSGNDQFNGQNPFGSEDGSQAGDQNGFQSGGQDQTDKAAIGIVIKEDSGVIIAQVNGDNAKKAGFAEGDKVVSIDGKEVTTSNDLITEVQSHKAGDVVSVTVERDGQAIEIKTELQ